MLLLAAGDRGFTIRLDETALCVDLRGKRIVLPTKHIIRAETDGSRPGRLILVTRDRGALSPLLDASGTGAAGAKFVAFKINEWLLAER